LDARGSLGRELDQDWPGPVNAAKIDEFDPELPQTGGQPGKSLKQLWDGDDALGPQSSELAGPVLICSRGSPAAFCGVLQMAGVKSRKIVGFRPARITHGCLDTAGVEQVHSAASALQESRILG